MIFFKLCTTSNCKFNDNVSVKNKKEHAKKNLKEVNIYKSFDYENFNLFFFIILVHFPNSEQQNR